MRSPFAFDLSPLELSPSELRKRLEADADRRISPRLFAYWRKNGTIPKPYRRYTRGRKGEICAWRLVEQYPEILANVLSVSPKNTGAEATKRTTLGRQLHNERQRETSDLTALCRLAAAHGLGPLARVALLSLLRGHGVEVGP